MLDYAYISCFSVHVRRTCTVGSDAALFPLLVHLYIYYFSVRRTDKVGKDPAFFILFVHFYFSVHVRRTDKVGTEAAFHSIDEYMLHVDKYYDQLEKRQKVDQRRIFLATDDPLLLQEAKFKYG